MGRVDADRMEVAMWSVGEVAKPKSTDKSFAHHSRVPPATVQVWFMGIQVGFRLGSSVVGVRIGKGLDADQVQVCLLRFRLGSLGFRVFR